MGMTLLQLAIRLSNSSEGIDAGNRDFQFSLVDKLGEISQFISKARGQMNLIDNTFQLLADQIVTMRSPKELGGQLDELIDGVEAVRTTARETEALMETVSH